MPPCCLIPDWNLVRVESILSQRGSVVLRILVFTACLGLLTIACGDSSESYWEAVESAEENVQTWTEKYSIAEKESQDKVDAWARLVQIYCGPPRQCVTGNYPSIVMEGEEAMFRAIDAELEVERMLRRAIDNYHRVKYGGR